MNSFCRVVASTLTILMITAIPCGCKPGDARPRIDLMDKGDSDESLFHEKERSRDVFLFGFDLRAEPEEDAKQYLPFLEYLEKSTGRQFEIRFTPADRDIIDDLGNGVVQFAAVGAVSHLRAREKYGVIPVARGLNAHGRAEYQSMIVVKRDSPIEKVDDLRAKRFAFGSRSSTQGHLIPRIMLAERGIALNDLGEYEFTGSHFNCANAVISGRFDAGGMQDTMARKLEAEGMIRILAVSDFFPSSGISANPRVPPGVLAKVRQALLDFQPKGRDAPGLYHWEMTEMPNGFTGSSDEDYRELSRWMREFALLKP